MNATIKSEIYGGYEIDIYKIDKLFNYDIFSVNKYKIHCGKSFKTAEEALQTAKDELDDSLLEKFDIELNEKGEEELKSFLAENVKTFDPDDDNQFFAYVGAITDSKRDAGVGNEGTIEIKVGKGYGNVAIFKAGDECFQVVKR